MLELKNDNSEGILITNDLDYYVGLEYYSERRSN